MAQRQNKQSNTDTIPQEADNTGGKKRRQVRERASCPEAKEQVHRPRGQTFYLYDLQGVGQ